MDWNGGRLRLIPVDLRPVYAVPLSGEVCSPGVVTAASHVPSLPQCSYRESGGEQCELESGHEGGHTFEDSLFHFWQVRRGLQGPVCRTRRGPREYVYEEGPMCL